MSDAIEGEAGAYVPCLELPSPFPADPDGAITGSGVGFVSAGVLASPMPADPTGAITGSGVGLVPKPCCPWVWQNGTGDGVVGSGLWSIDANCLLSLDVAAGTSSDDFVIFEMQENDDTADAYAGIRAGVDVSAVITIPFISSALNPPSLEECGTAISLSVQDAAHTVTSRIDAAFRLFAYGSGTPPDNALIHLTMFGKQRQIFFNTGPGTHYLSLHITSTSFDAILDGNVANLNTSITPPNLAPPPIDMASLSALRIRTGTNDMSLPGVFTAQPSLPA